MPSPYSVDDFADKFDSLYRLVIVASRRANQLSKNESHGFGAAVKARKPTVDALDEVLAGKLSYAGQTIVLALTGSIAAYKACEIASRLVEGGAKVLPVLSHGAAHFVGPASLEGITGNRVISEMFEALQNPDIEHIAVARKADLFLIAPATANILAKAAHGIADDWLTTTLLATRAPILFAPAMNTQMYQHPATQANIETLKGRGCHFVGPEAGNLACGEVGPGRLIETRAVLEAVYTVLNTNKDLTGRRVLVTSGPNHEPIDPVRFIGNRSSGMMGRAVALEALRRGAQVTVVSGPAITPLPHDAEVVRVETAQQMLEAVEAHFTDADIFVAAAAFADYRLDSPPDHKQKRNGAPLNLTLESNPDIAAHIGFKKQPDQICVGFAAETQDLVQNAKVKLKKKNLDLIVANQVGRPHSGFGSDTTIAWFISPNEETEELPLISKNDLARRIFDRVVPLLAQAKNTAPAS